jgi:DNA-binding winged helix-turn-helix (wHTH) protein
MERTVLVIDDDRRLYKLIVRSIYEADFVGRFLPADSEVGRIRGLSPSLIVVADTCLGPDPSTRLQALMADIPAPFFVICSLRERPRNAEIGEPRPVGLDACTTLQLGALDTVVRGDPMDLIRARLRRACQLARALYPAPGLMALPGDLSFDASRRRLQSAEGAIQLGHIESRILAGLARARGDRISRSDLFEIAWRDELEPNDRRLDVRISAINHKLAELSRGKVRISCVRNAGYCLGRAVSTVALS